MKRCRTRPTQIDLPQRGIYSLKKHQKKTPSGLTGTFLRRGHRAEQIAFMQWLTSLVQKFFAVTTPALASAAFAFNYAQCYQYVFGAVEGHLDLPLLLEFQKDLQE